MKEPPREVPLTDMEPGARGGLRSFGVLVPSKGSDADALCS